MRHLKHNQHLIQHHHGRCISGRPNYSHRLSEDQVKSLIGNDLAAYHRHPRILPGDYTWYTLPNGERLLLLKHLDETWSYELHHPKADPIG